MKKILLCVISLFSILHIGEIYAQSWVLLEEKSIKEIKQNIDKLNSDKNLIAQEYWEFKLTTQLSSFFKIDLSQDEIKSIEILITKYNINFSQINEELITVAKNLEDTAAIKIQLLESKKQLYLDLLPFVDELKYNDYITFIKWDATITKKHAEVNSQIVATKEVYNQKVTKIEEKIIQNREKMDMRLQKVISEKIDEKIETMKNNDTFIKLSDETKVQVIEKAIDKVNLNIATLEKIESQDRNILQKINLYHLLNDKLLIFKSSISIEQKK